MTTLLQEEEQVGKVVEKLTTGLLNGDKALLESIMDENVSYGHSGGNVEGKRQVIEAFATGKYKFGTIEISDQTTQVFGDTAVVRHHLHATTADAGKTPGEVHLFILTAWYKTEQGWKLVARQAVKNPQYMK